MPPKAKGAKKKTGYQMPEKFDDGFVLKDIFKHNWTLGKPIGQGGFGLIYLANKGENIVKKPEDALFVVKIEPKDNGPLFCESHFYVNSAKEDDLKVFIRANSLKHLAMPKYISSGLCTYNEKEYRFLVMDRYVKDLQTFVNQTPSHQINEIGVMCLMRQILYALEYIHQKGYTHGDIKGANIMLKNDHESYLVDYGLAYRFQRENVHQKYVIKPERRHNGTIEYTSRDAHDGAQTFRRSDLEILGFCAIHWLSGTLPWIDLIKNPEQVHQSKIKSMKNVKEFLNHTLNTVNNVSDCVKSFMEFYLNEVNKLEFDSEPPYLQIHSKITTTLTFLGHSASAIDNFRLFSVSKNLPKATSQKRTAADEAICPNDSDDSSEVLENVPTAAKGRRRVNKPIVKEINSDEEENENSIDEKPTSKAKAKPKSVKAKTTTKTPKKQQEVNSANYEDLKVEDLSGIENNSDEDFNIKEKASKKSKNIFQSTAIDQTIDSVKNKRIQKLEEDESKQEAGSPRNGAKSRNTRAALPEQTPNKNNQNENILMASTGSGSKAVAKKGAESKTLKKPLDSDDSDNDENRQRPEMAAHAANPVPDKCTLNRMNTPKLLGETKLNGAQKDVLNKIKPNNPLKYDAPRSPLALANLEKDSGFILVKKRKNIVKSDAYTQTEQSYLQTHKFKL